MRLDVGLYDGAKVDLVAPQFPELTTAGLDAVIDLQKEQRVASVWGAW